MADERNSGFAELKAVALDLLQGERPAGEPRQRQDEGSTPMHNRDPDRDNPPPATASGEGSAAGHAGGGRAPEGQPDAMPAASDRGHESSAPASGTHHEAGASARHRPGRAGGRHGEELNATDDRQEDYGAGADAHLGEGDADSTRWPPQDWDENGNAHRHHQSREAPGPGGYEDRSRELRDFGPGPEGSSGEAWRTYEHYSDSEGGEDQGAARKDHPQDPVDRDKTKD